MLCEFCIIPVGSAPLPSDSRTLHLQFLLPVKNYEQAWANVLQWCKRKFTRIFLQENGFIL